MSGFQFCKPNCPERRPACQDTCEFHAERKRIFEERKAQINEYKEATNYTHEAIAKNFDRRIKSTRAFRGSNWRRVGRG